MSLTDQTALQEKLAAAVRRRVNRLAKNVG
jgi:hypothetical protein